EGLVDRDFLCPPLHADAVDLAIFETRPRRRHRVLGDEDRRAIGLVRAFETRGDVHRVAHHGVFETLLRTDIADERLAGVEADAGLHLVTGELPRSVELRKL